MPRTPTSCRVAVPPGLFATAPAPDSPGPAPNAVGGEVAPCVVQGVPTLLVGEGPADAFAVKHAAPAALRRSRFRRRHSRRSSRRPTTPGLHTSFRDLRRLVHRARPPRSNTSKHAWGPVRTRFRRPIHRTRRSRWRAGSLARASRSSKRSSGSCRRSPWDPMPSGPIHQARKGPAGLSMWSRVRSPSCLGLAPP
jgi:hypothetical protein